MTPLRFIALGEPEPKGSAKVVPIRRKFPFTVHSFRELLTSVAVTSDNPRVKNWQRAIAAAAQMAMGQQTLFDAVGVQLAFFVVPPQRIPADRGGLPIVRDDADKLCRAALDAMSGIVYADDSRVVDLTISKRYADVPARARVEVTVTPIVIKLPLSDERNPDGIRPRRTRADRTRTTAAPLVNQSPMNRTWPSPASRKRAVRSAAWSSPGRAVTIRRPTAHRATRRSSSWR